jgi:hypothetical protein
MRIKRSVMLVGWMIVAAGRIRLPDLDERVGYTATIFVEHAATYDDPFTEGIRAIMIANVGSFA